MALRREIEIQADPTRYKLGPARLFLDDVQLIYKTVQEAAREKAQDSQDNEPPTVDIL